MQIVAHRGYAGEVKNPNSREALDFAVSIPSTDFIEIDLRHSKRGIVVEHDHLEDYSDCLEIEQVTDIIPPSIGIVAEVKESQIMDDVKEFARQSENDVIIQSFVPAAIPIDYHSTAVLYSSFIDCDETETTYTLSTEREVRETIHTRDCSHVCVDWRDLSTELVSKCNDLELDVFAWTIRSPTEGMYAQNFDIEGVITDICNPFGKR